jgi:hypothetical protein
MANSSHQQVQHQQDRPVMAAAAALGPPNRQNAKKPELINNEIMNILISSLWLVVISYILGEILFIKE